MADTVLNTTVFDGAKNDDVVETWDFYFLLTIPVYFVVAKLGYYPNFESNKIFYISKLGLGPEWLFGINQYW